ncbi:CRISPR-associated helicase Cas3' [Micromonospora sp. NPDC051296]|uniref:CRISPR-associated helicase Cas3' n=1 Tax=Micromonospora sp. NPDC051296 TaxID=3155046 RepID=UPI003426C9DA
MQEYVTFLTGAFDDACQSGHPRLSCATITARQPQLVGWQAVLAAEAGRVSVPSVPPVSEQVDVRIFWGKAGTAKQGEETVPHPLICHTIDTAVVAELLYDRLLSAACRAELSAAFAPLGGQPAVWVGLMCGLHDLGKLSPAFQALRVDVAAKLLPPEAAAQTSRLSRIRARGGRTDTFHGILTCYHVRQILLDWGAEPDTARTVAQAIGAHHGSFFSDQVLVNAESAVQDHGGQRWARWAEELFCRTADLLGLPDPRTVSWSEVRFGTGGAVALAGLTTVSDWIASGAIRKATHAGSDIDLVAYLQLARGRAVEQVVDRLGWSGWAPAGDLSFGTLYGQRPRPLQQACEGRLESKNRPGILIVEAPTGEGKTKIALQATVGLIDRLRLAGFFVAMPTRATSNQMFDEVDELVTGFDWGLSVKLLHGTAAEHLADRRARMARSEPISPENVGTDDPAGNQDAAVREWFTKLKALLAPLAVGTVDRVLQGGIRSPWAPVPLVGLSNRVIVFDEVHGYQVYMSTILDRILWWLGWLGVPVILLSATLPRIRREELLRHWYAGAQRSHPDKVELCLPVLSYPHAVWLDDRGVPDVVQAEASSTNADRRVELLQLADADLTGWLLRQARGGQGVAVVHNLVRRVDHTVELLEAAIGELPEPERPRVVSLTGQLTAAARAKVEQELRDLFGLNGSRAPQAGYIVVGTQVLEQSLDLDFDAMASDLAPVDSLIQRAGRLHRFRRTDPGAPPTLALLGVTEKKAGPAWPPHTTRIYQDAVLLRTWALLRNRRDLRTPDEVPELVDAVYSEPDRITSPVEWETRWQHAQEKLDKAQRADQDMASALFLPPPIKPDALLELTRHPRYTGQTRKPDGRSRRYE